MGDMRNAYKILVGRPEGKRPVGRLRCRWEENIGMNLREIGMHGLDSCGSGQGPVAGSCEHGNEPSSPIKADIFLIR
jgi:hypothetical protein